MLSEDDFTSVRDATAATLAEFVRNEAGEWNFRPGVHGFDEDPDTFTHVMGRAHQS